MCFSQKVFTMHSMSPILLLLITIPLITYANRNCSWCTFTSTNISTCGTISQSNNYTDWTLVRAIGSSHGRWFPNNDNLIGTNAYNDNGVNEFNIGNFETYAPGYNQFLFTTYVQFIFHYP